MPGSRSYLTLLKKPRTQFVFLKHISPQSRAYKEKRVTAIHLKSDSTPLLPSLQTTLNLDLGFALLLLLGYSAQSTLIRCQMVLGKKNIGSKFSYSDWDEFDCDAMSRELGVVRHTGAMGRKRIEPSPCTSPLRAPLKRQCSIKPSPLEALPQDVVVRILCGVEHDDLGHLLVVSKSMKLAALIAKEGHFAYRTPSSKTATLRSFTDVEDGNIDSDGPMLNAPKQTRGPRSRRNLNSISVALFRSPGQD